MQRDYSMPIWLSREIDISVVVMRSDRLNWRMKNPLFDANSLAIPADGRHLAGRKRYPGTCDEDLGSDFASNDRTNLLTEGC